MRIETYEDKYEQDVIDMMLNFYKESLGEYGLKIEIPAVKATLDANRQTTFLMVVEGKAVGILAGIVVHPIMNGDTIFQELVWYMEHKYRTYGVIFLRKVEKALKQKGFTGIVMVCMHNSKTDKLFKFYQRAEYVPLETHFMRRF